MNDAPVPLGSGPQLLVAQFLNNLNTFMAEVTTLHELVSIAHAQLEPQDQARFDERVQAFTAGSIDGLPEDVKVRVGQAGAAWFESLRRLPQEDIGFAFGIPVGSQRATAATRQAEEAFNQLIEAFPDTERAGRFVLGFSDVLIAVPRAEVLYASIVVAGVSLLRALLRGIALEIAHRAEPEVREPDLLAQLERLIEKKGLPEWDAWFGERIGATVGAVIPDQVALGEVLSRRNVIVHHGGLVSHRYAAAHPNPGLGKRLLTDAAYVERALDLLLRAGAIFACAAWPAIDETLREPSQMMLNYNLMKYVMPVGRWRLVQEASTWLLGQNAGETTLALAFIHVALANKRLGRADEAQTALRSWTAPRADFELARLCLLDRLDEAFALAAELLEQGAISRRDLETWPVLAELRADLRYPTWSEGRPGQAHGNT